MVCDNVNPPKFWWIDPDAKFHQVPAYGHWDWGKAFLHLKKGYSLEDANKEVYQKMAEHGWFRVVLTDYMGKTVLEYDQPKRHFPSNRQIKSIKDLGIEVGADEVKPIWY